MSENKKINLTSLKQHYLNDKGGKSNVKVEAPEHEKDSTSISPDILSTNASELMGSENKPEKAPAPLKLKGAVEKLPEEEKNTIVSEITENQPALKEIKNEAKSVDNDLDLEKQEESMVSELAKEEKNELFVNYDTHRDSDTESESDKKVTKMSKAKKMFIGASGGIAFAVLSISAILFTINGVPNDGLEADIGQSGVEKILEEEFVSEEIFIGAARFEVEKSGTGKYRYDGMIYEDINDLIRTMEQEVEKLRIKKIIDGIKNGE